jgi:hypothetical protein
LASKIHSHLPTLPADKSIFWYKIYAVGGYLNALNVIFLYSVIIRWMSKLLRRKEHRENCILGHEKIFKIYAAFIEVTVL